MMQHLFPAKLLLLVAMMMSAPTVLGESFEVKPVIFNSDGINLSGTLVHDAANPPFAAVVFVHGSGAQTGNINLAKFFAKQGIATLVYDKRGVGNSQGEYEGNQAVSEMNIAQLARDAVAALNALRQTEFKSIPIGLTGISQAGWIVPLAAEYDSAVDFLLLWSGPVCKVSEEDIFSKYTADQDTQSVPSYQEALSARKTRYVWPSFLGKDSDPSTSLAKLDIPGLWIFGAQDGSIPVDLSIDRLTQLQRGGYPYDYVLFSHLGHHNIADSFATAHAWLKKLVAENASRLPADPNG